MCFLIIYRLLHCPLTVTLAWILYFQHFARGQNFPPFNLTAGSAAQLSELHSNLHSDRDWIRYKELIKKSIRTRPHDNKSCAGKFPSMAVCIMGQAARLELRSKIIWEVPNLQVQGHLSNIVITPPISSTLICRSLSFIQDATQWVLYRLSDRPTYFCVFFKQLQIKQNKTNSD